MYADQLLRKQHFCIRVATSEFVSKARTCATTITAKLNQRAPELMLCDICNQSLNNTVVLPCNHRCCLSCINKLVCLASGMQCAVCHRHIVFTHEQIQLPSSRPEQAVRGLFLGHGAPPLTDGTDTKRQKLEAHYPDPYRQPDSNTPDTNLINITPELEPYFSMDSVNSAVAAPTQALNGGADNGRLHPSIADGIQTPYRSMQAEPLDRQNLGSIEDGLQMFGMEDLLPMAGAHADIRQQALPPHQLARRKRIAPISIPKLVTLLPLDQLPFDQLPLESADLQLAGYEASLKMPAAPKPTEPTKTGRRRRMIPLKILDHKVGLSMTSRAIKVGYLKTDRERNREAAQIFRVRDQQYLKQLQDSITQLEGKNEELTKLKARLSAQRSNETDVHLQSQLTELSEVASVQKID